MSILVETFPSVGIGGHFQNAFIGRVTDLDVTTDRDSALARLAQFHEQAWDDLGFSAFTKDVFEGQGLFQLLDRALNANASMAGKPMDSKK